MSSGEHWPLLYSLIFCYLLQHLDQNELSVDSLIQRRRKSDGEKTAASSMDEPIPRIDGTKEPATF